MNKIVGLGEWQYLPGIQIESNQVTQKTNIVGFSN